MRSQKAAIFTFRFEGRLYSCTAHLMSLMKFKQITRGKDLFLKCPQEIGHKSVRVLMSFPYMNGPTDLQAQIFGGNRLTSDLILTL